MDGERKRLGGMKCEVRGGMRKDGQRFERVLSAPDNLGQSGLGKVSVGKVIQEVYNILMINYIQTRLLIILIKVFMWYRG